MLLTPICGLNSAIPLHLNEDLMWCVRYSPGSGTIEFVEFLEMMKRRPTSTGEQDMLEAFKVFDADGNGFITAAELRRVMTGIGETLTDAEVNDMLRAADTNNDGKINYDGEF